jgi:prokaryotic ubiquitin-like protein Pup
MFIGPQIPARAVDLKTEHWMNYPVRTAAFHTHAAERILLLLEAGGEEIMSEQVRKSARPDTAGESQQTAEGARSLAGRGKDIKASIDDLLDEIDNVLEENAEEFVSGYVQRGGE